MKKRLMLLAGSLFALATVATTAIATRSNDEASLLMQNVEALTDFETAFQDAYNAMYDAIYGTVSGKCPSGSLSCSDVTTELSIPGWWSVSVTFYFYKES